MSTIKDTLRGWLNTIHIPSWNELLQNAREAFDITFYWLRMGGNFVRVVVGWILSAWHIVPLLLFLAVIGSIYSFLGVVARRICSLLIITTALSLLGMQSICDLPPPSASFIDNIASDPFQTQQVTRIYSDLSNLIEAPAALRIEQRDVRSLKIQVEAILKFKHDVLLGPQILDHLHDAEVSVAKAIKCTEAFFAKTKNFLGFSHSLFAITARKLELELIKVDTSSLLTTLVLATLSRIPVIRDLMPINVIIDNIRITSTRQRLEMDKLIRLARHVDQSFGEIDTALDRLKQDLGMSLVDMKASCESTWMSKKLYGVPPICSSPLARDNSFWLWQAKTQDMRDRFEVVRLNLEQVAGTILDIDRHLERIGVFFQFEYTKEELLAAINASIEVCVNWVKNAKEWEKIHQERRQQAEIAWGL